MLGVNRSLGLDVFDSGQGLTAFDVITLFYVQVGNTAKGGGSYIDIRLGLDLSRAIDDGDEILMHNLARSDLCNVGLVVKNGANDNPCQNQDSDDNQDDLFSAHCCFLCACLQPKPAALLEDCFRPER